MGEKRIVPEPPATRRAESRILDEAPPALAVVLWQYVRHLSDWIDASVAERKALFHSAPPRWVSEKRREAHAVFPDIAANLMAVESVFDTPFTVDPRSAADAMDALARWAEARGYTETSIQFSELSARIDPADARRANLAGRLARNAGDYPRAETWLERGIGLGRRQKDWVEYTRGHLGAGILCMTVGREARARRHLNTASTIAMREGHEWLAAEAQHDLFQFMTLRGNWVDAEVHARRALAWYPKHHQRFPFFAADLGFLLVCQQHHSAAAALLRPFVRIVNPPHNVLGFSVLVRALASAGSRREFERMRSRLLDLIHRHPEHEAAARWNLAHADRAVGNWESAVANARAAADLARSVRDLQTEQAACALLAQLEAREPLPPEQLRTDGKFRELLASVVTRLENWSPTRRGRMPSRSRAEWAA